MSRSLLEPVGLAPGDLGELAEILPGEDPKVQPGPSFGVRRDRSFIPVCEPALAGGEASYVQQAIESGWLSSGGPFVRKFEAQFAAFCGTRHGVVCSSGTAAMHLALAALGLQPGDEVIIPAFTMIATANAVAYCGATPVLVDAEPVYRQMDVRQVAAKLGPRTRAMVAVHIYGHPVDMDPLLDLAARHDLWVIEDAAEAHGALYRGRTVGNLGHAAAFSFYANKIITTGEGGAVTTNDDQLAEVVRSLRDHAFNPACRFWHQRRGFNYRMASLQAALGLAQLEKVHEFIEARRGHALEYSRRLAGIPGLSLPAEAPWARNVHWMYALLVDRREFGLGRDDLRRVLAEHGVETRSFFVPMHCQPPYWHALGRERYPVAERLCRDGLILPSSSTLTLDEIDHVTETIRKACRR